jgi:hypothetical protein
MMNLREALDRALADPLQRRALGPRPTSPVTDEEWAWLKDEGYAAVFEEVDGLNRALRDLLERRRAGTASRHVALAEGVAPARGLRGIHEQALSRVLLHLIDNENDRFGVRAFRPEILRRHLISPHNVPRWIKQKHEDQGPPTIIVSGRERRAQLLAYVDGEEVIRRVATRAGAPLDRLRRISEQVSAFGGWHPARVATYVLTGVEPTVPTMEVSVRWQTPVAARSRIVLTVDPTCTPQEVAAVYRVQRARHFGRVKRLSPKHARLAVFAATHEALPPAEQMAAWNSGHRQRSHQYRRVAIFNRDSRIALTRLTEFGDRRRWGR